MDEKETPSLKKKKEVFDMIKNGRDFKLIIKRKENGDIHSVMEKPNIKTWTQENLNVIASGSHVFSNSEFNHVDFFQNGFLIYKEYPEIIGSTNYGYTLSGGIIII
jgi:hypothetical protein